MLICRKRNVSDVKHRVFVEMSANSLLRIEKTEKEEGKRREKKIERKERKRSTRETRENMQGRVRRGEGGGGGERRDGSCRGWKRTKTAQNTQTGVLQ